MHRAVCLMHRAMQYAKVQGALPCADAAEAETLRRMDLKNEHMGSSGSKPAVNNREQLNDTAATKATVAGWRAGLHRAS